MPVVFVPGRGGIPPSFFPNAVPLFCRPESIEGYAIILIVLAFVLRLAHIPSIEPNGAAPAGAGSCCHAPPAAPNRNPNSRFNRMAESYPFIVQQPSARLDLAALTALICRTQLPDGAIPWSPGDKTDPWDHVESAMGLTIGGALPQARKAYRWMQHRQFEDGSWPAAITDGRITDATRETNHAAYLATGLYHYYLSTNDLAFVRGVWPAAAAGIDFALRHQADGGEIYWAVSPEGSVDPMALLTGCSSISFSLKCALALAGMLGEQRPAWRCSLNRLERCIRTKPYCFNMTKARFSMDWFYPVLCGAVTGEEAAQRIDKHWKKFVVRNLGVRCVSDQPWVTIAESSELVLALCAMENHLLANIVFGWLSDHTFDDGTFWCGFTFPDMVIWPGEKIAWTNAVVMMAADALFDLTPASRMFSHRFGPKY